MLYNIIITVLGEVTFLWNMAVGYTEDLILSYSKGYDAWRRGHHSTALRTEGS